MEDHSQVEILIHIGAPSRAVDDAHYRSLAHSYVNFQSTRTINILDRAHPGISNVHSRYELEGHGTVEQDPVWGGHPSSQSTGSLDPFKSPQASFRSVLDNAGSPHVLTRHVPEEQPVNTAEGVTMPSTQSPWETPSSIVQDSYLGNPINISTLTSPTRVLEHYLQHFDSPTPAKSTSQRTGDTIPHSSSSQSLAYPNSRDRLAVPSIPSTLPIPSTSSIIPVVPCTPPRHLPPNSGGLARMESTGENRETHVRSSQPDITDENDETTSDNIVEETMIESSDPSFVARADSEPAPTTRQDPSALETTPQALLRAASDIGPRASSQQRSLLTVSFLAEHGYTYESLKILSPEPEVGMVEVVPDDLVTLGLERIAQDLDIPRRYKPREQQRELRDFERGYWHVDCSNWDAQLKRNAWAYLANYIGTGVAGWGVWCTRDSEFTYIRVFCWGKVVPHIYLLLYLATQRKILYTGASWHDGESLPIIVMETRDQT
ncbi:hypothetical protein F5Y04DRAFT_22472 [Hypomontagnella monticulosa]|nr:hypothetical protein F5Y04DRAFT_22472 [Hypomontagnella monticulosa]